MIEYCPAGTPWDEAVNVATPLLFKGRLPSGVLELKNSTAPVGAPDPELRVTVAVNVQVCGGVTVVADSVSAVDVAYIGSTVTVTGEEVDGSYTVSPEYFAITV